MRTSGRKFLTKLIFAGFLVAIFVLPACGEETEAQRAARLKQMTAEQKDELQSKKDRFDDLGDAERERLRKLHVSIESATNSPELQKTLQRYHAWLSTLSSIQRDELHDLPADKRIERIKELLKQQEIQRFRDFLGNLQDDDRTAINKWLADFVTQHEEAIIEQADQRMRRNISDAADPEAKHRMLAFAMTAQRQNPQMPAPTREDYNTLIASLSEATQTLIEQSPADQQSERVRELVGAAIFVRRLPPVSDEDLRKFYTGLQGEQRERLEGLEREEFKRRLTWMYHAEKNGWTRGGPGGRGWQGGFGPPGPGGRPGDGPRGDGRPGEGRRGSDDNRGGPPGDRGPKGPPPEGKPPLPPSEESPPPSP